MSIDLLVMAELLGRFEETEEIPHQDLILEEGHHLQ